jgi:hypothetical protein
MTLILMEVKSMHLEHPAISEMNKKGYLGGREDMATKKDWFGFDIDPGDEVVEFDGDIVLKENLEEYLKANGFEFKTA